MNKSESRMLPVGDRAAGARGTERGDPGRNASTPAPVQPAAQPAASRHENLQATLDQVEGFCWLAAPCCNTTWVYGAAPVAL